MFIGHSAVGFASKSAAPRASLGVLMAAPMLPDLLWPFFLMTGWEKVRIDPGNTAFTPLDFVSYPYSHSWAAACGWAALSGFLYWAYSRYVAGAMVVSVGVLSHWVLDAVTHRPDLPILPGRSARVGFELWNSAPATIAIESAMFASGIWLYMSLTRPRDAVGHYALWSFVALQAISYAATAFGPPPPSPEFLARFELVTWLFPLWAWWFDRHRAVASELA